MRRDDLPPRHQTRLRLTLRGLRRRPTTLRTGLLLEHLPHQIPAQLPDPVTLGGVAERLEHPLHGVQGTGGVVAAERLLMRPTVAHLGQLEDQRPDCRAEAVAEHLAPRGLHALEQERHITGAGVARRAVQPPVHLAGPVGAVEPLPGSRAGRAQPVAHQVERPTDALAVAHHHAGDLLRRGRDRAADIMTAPYDSTRSERQVKPESLVERIQ